MRAWRVVLVAAIFLGILTAGITYRYVRNATLPSSGTMAPRMARVTVARVQIPAYTAITRDMVYQKEVPEGEAEPDVVPLEDAIGSITKQEILEGRQVVRPMLFNKQEAAGLAFAIPRGMRAVTIPVNEVAGVGGFVKPGDRVDILGTFRSDVASVDMTTTVLRNIRVLAVAQQMDEKDRNKAVVAASVTLAVTPQDAEKLVLAGELGSLRLALCPMPEAASASPYAQAGSASATLASAPTMPRRVTSSEIVGAPAKPGRTAGFQAPGYQAPGYQASGYVSSGPPVPQQSSRSAVSVGSVAAGSGGSGAAGKSPAEPKVKVIEIIRGTERDYVPVDRSGEK